MKKRMTMLLLAIAMVFMCFGCTNSSADSLDDTQGNESDEAKEGEGVIGIISAMDNEIALLLKQADIDHVDHIGDMDFHVGELCGKQVVIVKSGIGKVRAAAGIAAMLDTYDGFEWYEGYGGDHGYYPCDPDLVSLAYDSAVRVLGEEHVFKGTIATGDQFIASEEYVKILQNDFHAIACEMEGAAIAVVCSEYEMPFVVIRAMSDKADGLAHESYENMADRAADNSSRIIVKMLESM